MKFKICLLLSFFYFQLLYAQMEFSCVIPDEPKNKNMSLKTAKAIATKGSLTEVIVIAVDLGARTLLPSWYDAEMGTLHDFFDQATFGDLNYNAIILKKDENHAFEMPIYYYPPFNGTCEHVHLETNVRAVIDSADKIYNFYELDDDGDGVVEVHFTSIGPRSGGIGGACWGPITTNDTDPYGNYIDVIIAAQSRGSSRGKYMGVFYHESGHSLFYFPDMDHSGTTAYHHHGVGGFDVMCQLGFQGVPSLYNPFFRHDRNWFTPTEITGNLNDAKLEEFQKEEKCYVYYPSSTHPNALDYQRFYITYHDYDENFNYYYSRWPYKDQNKGGVIIWHTKDDTVTKSGTYSDWREMDVDIEAAHGKYLWTETSDTCINTNIPNALKGRDSLEIRKVIGGDVVSGGPYYGENVDKGSASIFYTPDDNKELTFYSNPNSNWYTTYSDTYSQSILSGLSIKDIHSSGGFVYADFLVNNYTITKNTTLVSGKWYITNTITINSGVTVNIESPATLIFENNALLNVNGTLNINPGVQLEFNGGRVSVYGNLNAIGTSSNKITFDFINKTASSGIRFICSNGTLKYCNIKNADKGIYLSSGGSNPTIENCNISNNNYGIYLGMDSYNLDYIRYNTISNNTYDGIYIDAGGPIQSIDHNTITNNGRYGIYSYYRDPDISRNTISENSNAGIYLYYYSSPYIGVLNHINENGTGINSYRSQPYLGYNEIEDNSTAIFANSSSSINMSMDNLVKNGSIGLKADNSSTITVHYCPIVGYDDPGDYACYANHNSTINATNNCWDGTQPTIYTANGGVVYWQPAEPPCGGLAKIASSGNTAGEVSEEMPTSENTDSFDKDLEQAFQHIINKEYNDAIAIYQDKYKNTNDLRIKRFILTQLAFCYKKAGKAGFIDFLNKQVRDELLISDELYALTIELENSFLLKERDYDAVIENLKLLKSNYSDYDEIQKNALYGLLHLMYSYSKDTTMSKKYFYELNNRYPDDELTLNAMLYMGETEKYLLAKQNMELRNEQTETEIAEKIIPEKFALKENYPNPFNPSTTIQYDLPEDVKVVLEVFDIQGQKVKTLVNGFKEAGYYEVIFDGSHLASGVYIYKIKAGNFTSSKRMLLIK